MSHILESKMISLNHIIFSTSQTGLAIYLIVFYVDRPIGSDLSMGKRRDFCQLSILTPGGAQVKGCEYV